MAYTNQVLTFPWWEFFGGGLRASRWGNVKSFFENVLLAGEMLKSEKPTFNISPVGAFFFWGGGLCASAWANVKNFFENVLLAGEVLKSEKPSFNISPGGGMCFWLGKR